MSVGDCLVFESGEFMWYGGTWATGPSYSLAQPTPLVAGGFVLHNTATHVSGRRVSIVCARAGRVLLHKRGYQQHNVILWTRSEGLKPKPAGRQLGRQAGRQAGR